ncbi:hypothetical protein P8452_24678 [Trifolium repens]|nr:hypothetical protein P8452_24678 [Trifolium repens]
MNPAVIAAVVGTSRRRQSVEAPAMMGKNIQHTKSRIRRRSSNANACGSRKEEDEDEDEKKTFGYCFSPCYFEVKEWFWNWKTQHNAKKYFEDLPIMYPKKNVEVNHLEIFLLPDDILEMCLNRLPLTSLKKLNIKIYDADFLKGRFMFSVAGIRDGIFIVGGRSKGDSCFIKPFKKTYKEVIFFNPVTKSCHKLQSMKYARCDPILGVTEHSIIPYIRQRRSGPSNSSSKGFKRSFLLIALGGIDDDKLMYCGEMLAAYDIERGFWFAIETSSLPPKPPIEPKLVSSNDRFYNIMGA